jgi:hypothetical protein
MGEPSADRPAPVGKGKSKLPLATVWVVLLVAAVMGLLYDQWRLMDLQDGIRLREARREYEASLLDNELFMLRTRIEYLENQKEVWQKATQDIIQQRDKLAKELQQLQAADSEKPR